MTTWSHSGKRRVDLLDVLLQRRVAGGVIIDVEGCAQTFAGVQGDVGRVEGGAPVSGTNELRAGLDDRHGFGVESAVIALLRLQQEFREGLHAGEPDDEQDADEETGKREHIEDAAQALPAFALRIVEDRLAHG